MIHGIPEMLVPDITHGHNLDSRITQELLEIGGSLVDGNADAGHDNPLACGWSPAGSQRTGSDNIGQRYRGTRRFYK
jgi:hypothetical protein